MKKLIVYDLDGTLAASKSALDSEMAGLLHQHEASSGNRLKPVVSAADLA